MPARSRSDARRAGSRREGDPYPVRRNLGVQLLQAALGGDGQGRPADAGDIWTWTGIYADSKLIVSYLVGDRSGQAAIELMDDLRSRLANRVQITHGRPPAYLEAVEGAFGGDVDYAQVIKHTAPRLRQRAATARPNAPGSRKSAWKATPTKARLDLLRGGPQQDDADAHAAVYSPDERPLQEGREPRPHGRALHPVLQFHPDAR